tara:strand:+ start:1044 stop:1229 length:186 start_codon:yes stop_codon:yes gene_type:complete
MRCYSCDSDNAEVFDKRTQRDYCVSCSEFIVKAGGQYTSYHGTKLKLLEERKEDEDTPTMP